MADILLDAVIDTLKTLPFLLGVYILIEYIEHRSSDKLVNGLRKLGPFGAIGGGLLGAVRSADFQLPQPICFPEGLFQQALLSQFFFLPATKLFL